jgi:hypothetical protein
MSDKTEDSERAQRLQALRSLAQEQSATTDADVPPTPPTPPSASSAPPPSAAPATSANRNRLSPTAARPAFNGLVQEMPERRSPWIVLAAGLLIVALITTLGGVVARQRTSQQTAGAPAARQRTSQQTAGAPAVSNLLRVTPHLDGVACPSGFAVSPDDSAFVIVGYQTQCPDSDILLVNEPGKIVIYSTNWTTHKAQARNTVTLSLDTLSQKFSTPLPSQAPSYRAPPQPTVLYGAPIWSPHGARIVVPFVVRPACFCLVGAFYQFDEVGAPTLVGLLEFSASGQLQAALSAPYSATQQYLEWDTQQGALVPTTGQLTLAQTYSWNGAQLTPSSPLSAKAAPGPIGDPQHAATFSLWQTGWGGPIYLPPRGPLPTPDANGFTQMTFQQLPGVFTLTPTFTAWSPDGRYLLLPNFSALVVRLKGAPAPKPSVLQMAGLAQTSQVSARDAALNNQFADFAPAPEGSFVSPDALAWSPDGRLLAAAQDITFDPSASHQQVTLRDTGTGKIVATLTPAVNPQDPLELNPTTLGSAPLNLRAHPQLQWSADGSQLFLLNPTLGTISIWKSPA